jgi:hypothetical protein
MMSIPVNCALLLACGIDGCGNRLQQDDVVLLDEVDDLVPNAGEQDAAASIWAKNVAAASIPHIAVRRNQRVCLGLRAWACAKSPTVRKQELAAILPGYFELRLASAVDLHQIARTPTRAF